MVVLVRVVSAAGLRRGLPAVRAGCCCRVTTLASSVPRTATYLQFNHRTASIPARRWLSSSTGGEVDKAPAAADAVVTETKKEEGDGQTAPQADVVFECRHSFFFRLLTCATATQVVFWSSYQMLPAEVTMASSHWGYVGMVGAGAFAFIVRHFAHHYVSDVTIVSPTTFKFRGHTIWGNQSKERVVQRGSVTVQESKRYYAFKVPGDVFWYLCDTHDGKYYPDGEEGKQRLKRLLWGLKVEGGQDEEELSQDAQARQQGRVPYRERRKMRQGKK